MLYNDRSRSIHCWPRWPSKLATPRLGGDHASGCATPSFSFKLCQCPSTLSPSSPRSGLPWPPQLSQCFSTPNHNPSPTPPC